MLAREEDFIQCRFTPFQSLHNSPGAEVASTDKEITEDDSFASHTNDLTTRANPPATNHVNLILDTPHPDEGRSTVFNNAVVTGKKCNDAGCNFVIFIWML